MPTNPKDNKGGNLAEIRDLVGRRPKGSLTTRRYKWTKESDTSILANQAREEVSKVRTVNTSRTRFVERAKNVQAQKAYNKATGIAPIVDLHSRNKGWDKIKAIEPGELPDLD